MRVTKTGKSRELTFTYDPFGRRITKTLIKDEIGELCNAPNVCPRTTSYVYDNQNIVLEYTQTGGIGVRYLHGFCYSVSAACGHAFSPHPPAGEHESFVK